MVLRQLILPLVLCMFAKSIFAQSSIGDEDFGQNAIAQVTLLQKAVGNAPSDAERMESAESMAQLILEICKEQTFYNQLFPDWVNVGQQQSSDGAFRLFNWNVPKLDGRQHYHAVIWKETGESIHLSSGVSASDADESRQLKGDQWYGALYYTVEAMKHKGEVHYLLLGWDGHNALSNKKVMDVLWFDAKGNPHFGKPLLQHPNEKVPRSRRVFEYAKDAKFTLSYLPGRSMVVFEELQPLPGHRPGNYAFYAPGDAHNGYVFKDGTWNYVENVDMSRPKSEEGKAQFNFPAKPDLNKVRSTKTPLTDN